MRIDADARPRTRWQQHLLRIGLAFITLWGVAYFATFAGVVVLLGQLMGLLVAAVVLAAAVALLVALSRERSRRSIVIASIATLSTCLMVVVAAAHFERVPMMWFQPLQVDLAFPLIAAIATIIWSAFFGSWPARVLGTATTVAMIAVAVTVFNPPTPQDEGLRVPTPEEAFAVYKETVEMALSSDAPGARLADIQGQYHVTSVIVTDEGGVVTVTREWDPPSEHDGYDYPCRMITRTREATDHSRNCIEEDGGWRTVDELNYVRLHEGRYVAIQSADDSYFAGYRGDQVREAGGIRAATVAEVFAVRDSLRPLTEEELREQWNEVLAMEPEN